VYSREEIKQLKKDFWEGFGSFCENLPRFKYRNKRWILYNTKIKGVEMKFDATTEGAYVILEFNHPDETKRLEMLTLIEQYRVVFDSHFPDAIWEILYIKPCGTPVSRIYKHHPGLNIHRKEQWGEFFRFLSVEMNQLEKAFEELKEFLRDISYS
jgi:hypothetical protein